MTSIQVLASLLLTAAVMTACSNEDLIVDEPTPVTTDTPRTYTITVNATKGEATRALTIDGNTLNATWKAGEEVMVYGVTGEGSTELESVDPIGTLTARSSGSPATLKGELASIYKPTIGAKLRLKFLSDNYTGQKGTLEYIATNCDYATADVTITSVTDGNVTTTPASFENQQAVVRFSLKKQDGTSRVVATGLTVEVGSFSYDVSPDIPDSVIFVAIPASTNINVTLTATSDEGNFSRDKTGVTFEKGKYYAIGVKMNRIPTLGDLFYSDGSFSTTFEEGKTPIGVIAYVGTDVFTENGVTLRDGTGTLQSHGLVLCLKNAAGGVVWRRNGMTEITDMTSEPFVDDTGDLKRTDHVSGYANTRFLAEKENAETDYPAAFRAWNYSELPVPESTTGWFMPSIQQWVKIFTGLGGLNDSEITWQAWIDRNRTSIQKFETAMAKAYAFDKFPTYSYGLWSSSEATAGGANIVMVNTSGSDIGIQFGYTNKVFNAIVRPVLAF